MTIYCPRCGSPVGVAPVIDKLRVNQAGNLEVTFRDLVLNHQCLPLQQDRP